MRLAARVAEAREPGPGTAGTTYPQWPHIVSHHKHNHPVRHAGLGAVAFLDDDVVYANDLFETLHQASERHNGSAVGPIS